MHNSPPFEPHNEFFLPKTQVSHPWKILISDGTAAYEYEIRGRDDLSIAEVSRCVAEFLGGEIIGEGKDHPLWEAGE